VYPAARLAALALGIALFAALAVGGSALAHEGRSISVRLTPSRGSGVSGTATLKDVEGGVEVTLQMRNLPEPGVEHINHIHAGGTCADDRAGRTAPITIPLKTITARKDGTGSATTFIKGASVAHLFGEDEERFILLHAKVKKGQGIPPGIACADLVRPARNGASTHDEGAATSESGARGEPTKAVGDHMPGTGGPALLLPAAASLLGASVLGYAMLRRGA
jgi:hypothetical protein